MKVTNYSPLFSLNPFEDGFFSMVNRSENFKPMVNLREDEKGYNIEVDLPGVKKEDVNIELNDGILKISGERKFKSEQKDEKYHKTESFFGKFERSFSISKDIDTANIQAKQEDGVLEIFLPKAEITSQSKKIEIK